MLLERQLSKHKDSRLQSSYQNSDERNRYFDEAMSPFQRQGSQQQEVSKKKYEDAVEFAKAQI
jgi:hypothetical protein